MSKIEHMVGALRQAGYDLADHTGADNRDLAEVYFHMLAGHLAANATEEELTEVTAGFAERLPGLVTEYLMLIHRHEGKTH